MAEPAEESKPEVAGLRPETEKIKDWRCAELMRAGYSPVSAAIIAGCDDIDLHRAVELVESGCDPILAARILL